MARKFHLRSSLDLARLRARWRSEYGSAAHSEAEILAALTDVEKDIEDCDAEVDHLQAQIIFVQNQRQRLEEYKNCLNFLRSPIRKIPNETLLRIFDFACDMNELTSKKVMTMPALAISGVCARWRNLVKGYPILWSRICLNMKSIRPKHPNFPILDLYLECSRQTPLIIDLDGDDLDGDDLDGDVESDVVQPHHLSMCTTLFEHANHLKQLRVTDFRVGSALTENESPHFQSRHFPILEELQFPNILFWSSDSLDSYQNTPSLSCLSVCTFPLVNMSESKFPWEQLTVLSLVGHPDGMKRLLETCCKLTELRLEDYDNAEFYHRCAPPAIAPALEVLTLDLVQTSLSVGLVEVAFSSLTCPALTSLLIDGISDYECPWHKESLHAFISRSSFHLTTLSIKSIPFSDLDIIDLLRDLPSLLHLTIHDHEIATPITPLLIQSLHALPPASCVASSSALVMKLQSLEMQFGGYDSEEEPRDFNDKDFVSMVSSRWFPDGPQADGYGDYAVDDPNGAMRTACLRSVVMHFIGREVDEEIYRPLKYLEKAGMRVVITGA